jgi:4,5-dihydroxyphthalate decarboxylase
MRQAPEGKTLQEMMLAGELDAMMVPWPPNFPPESEGKVGRLFPDFRPVEQSFYAAHRVYPIMHTVVIKNSVLDEHPWVAERVYAGAQHAIEQFVAQKRAEDAPSPIWPRLTWTEQEQALGPNPWPSGLEVNRPTLETGIKYAVEQGMLKRPIAPEELFQYNGELVIGAS